MVFNQKTVDKIRANTRPGSAYFPIFFSQYAPKCRADLKVAEENGFWRIHSYGMVAIHKRDYMTTGGFDLSIKGIFKQSSLRNLFQISSRNLAKSKS